MKKEIMSQDIEDIFNLETELFPCLVDMRFLGVRVDMDAAHRLKEELVAEEKQCLQQVYKETGIDVQIWAARVLLKYLKKETYHLNVQPRQVHQALLKTFYRIKLILL